MKHLENALAAVVAILTPVKMTLLVTLVLVLVDLLTGLVAARKQGNDVTSSGLKRTVVKLLAYELLIVLSYLVDHYLSLGSIQVLNLVAGIIGITELKSNAENLNIIVGGGVLSSVLAAISSEDKSPPSPPSTPS